MLLAAIAALLIALAPARAEAQACNTAGTGTALANAAANLAVGAWCQMSPNGMSNFNEIPPTVSGLTTGYAEKMVWDPTGGKVYFIGSDHNAPQHFIVYDEATNGVSRLPDPPFGSATKHGYEHTLIDPYGRKIYHAPFNGKDVWSWNIATQGPWVQVIADLCASIGVACGTTGGIKGMDFFFERRSKGSILFHHLHSNPNNCVLYEYNVSSGALTVLQTGGVLVDCDGLYNFLEYNPIHKLVLFGGNTRLWTMNVRGTISAKGPAPISLNPGGSGGQVITSDPASGDYLVFNTSTQWWRYNPRTDQWAAQSGSAAPFVCPCPGTPSAGPGWGVVAAPIPRHGVTMFVKGQGGSSTMWLGKFAATDAATLDFWRNAQKRVSSSKD